MKRLVPLAIAGCALLVPAQAQDVSVSAVGLFQGNDDIDYYGQYNGIAAYSIATTACNVGAPSTTPAG